MYDFQLHQPELVVNSFCAIFIWQKCNCKCFLQNILRQVSTLIDEKSLSNLYQRGLIPTSYVELVPFAPGYVENQWYLTSIIVILSVNSVTKT